MIRPHSTGQLYFTYKIKMIFRYIKKFLTFVGFNLGYDKKLRVKLLPPGVESGWNNNGSFKYKNFGGESCS
jgi:hypothetical protein